MAASLVESVLPWRDRIGAAAKRYSLEPALVAAVVAQESGGRQYAQRVERGFWARYMKGILAYVAKTVFKADDFWVKYPDIFSSSYGLMQIMLESAIENGFTFEFPGELFDPDKNLDVGCRMIRRFLDASGSELRGALLKWNGGAVATYPDEVIAKRNAIRADGRFA